MAHFLYFGPSRQPRRYCLETSENKVLSGISQTFVTEWDLHKLSSTGKREKRLNLHGDLAVLAELLKRGSKARSDRSGPIYLRAERIVQILDGNTTRDRRGEDRRSETIAADSIARIRKALGTTGTLTNRSGSNPIRKDRGGGYSFLWSVLEETVESKGSSDPPQSAAIMQADTKRLNKIEGTVFDVSANDFTLDAQALERLTNIETECWNSGEDSRFYASLTLGFAILKSGPIKCRQHLTSFRKLAGMTEKRVPESMAARWILARRDLALASIEPDEEYKIKLTREAHRLFEAIRETSTLELPILLPGAQQEYSLSELKQIDPLFRSDSEVSRVIIPHRYIGTSAVILAEHMQLRGQTLLLKAIHHTNFVSAEALVPKMNADLLRLGTQVILRARFNSSEKSKSTLISDATGLIERIQSAERKQYLNVRKAAEWISNCCACLVLITVRDGDQSDHLQRMILHARELVEASQRVPDFLYLDPIYRLAVEASEYSSFEGFISDVQAGLKAQ